jgi:hypothetical protein
MGPTPRCAWCGRIQIGGTWGLDRRLPGDIPYSHGICPTCRAGFLKESLKSRTT